MAIEDAKLSQILYSVVLPLAIGILFLAIIIKNRRSWSSRIFAYFYTNHIFTGLNGALAPHKRELFADLGDLVSQDLELRNKGLIRILEIGIGPGANFNYYPKNCHVVGYDPNPYFRPALFERCEEVEVNLKRLVVAGAESLVDTPDSSVDVVVSTLVLCSVHNVDLVLKEVQRVLAPGGKFYFLEHVIAPGGNFYRTVHAVLHTVKKLMFAQHCHRKRDAEAAIRSAGFSRVLIKHFQIHEGNIFTKIALSAVIAGTASV